MKIVKVITGLGMGGAETQVCLLADKLSAEGHHVTIISLVGDSINIPVNKNIKVIELRMKKNILGFITSLYKLVSIFSTVKPNIIHAHMYHANIMARVAAIFTLNRRRLVCTAHSNNEGGRIRMLSYRFTDFMCSKTTNVSKGALNHFISLKAFKRDKSEVVYNGLNFDRFKFADSSAIKIRDEFNIPEDIKLILSVGRLTEAKDYPNLLKAVSKLNDQTYKLLIVGDGDLRGELEQVVERLNLKSRVIFAGIRTDVHEFYSAADIFVLASRWEGFGLVVAEAMGSGCPVVSTDCGGVSEVVGCNDYIVPTNDYNALALKIDEILSLSENQKQILIEKNRNHVINHFSIDKIVNKWLGIYNSKVKN
ncbi:MULTISPECIES: glycosyltransferase [Rahnella]|uniref:glycosyltransferase n=1 Tax=Rahnella TaxID=34037 RepID=UPI003D27E68E